MLRFGSGFIVYLAGGLGNQLFMAAAGFELAKSYGAPLWYDSSFYRASKLRQQSLDYDAIPGEKMGSESPRVSIPLIGGRVVPAPRSLSVLSAPPLFESGNPLVEPKAIRSSPGRTLFGYFQSTAYFPNVYSEISRWFPSPDVSLDILKNRFVLSNANFIGMHVRRGDLLKPRHAKSLAPMSYFERAVRLVKAEVGELPVVVFTDSPAEVRREILSSQAMRSLDLGIFDDSGLTPIQVLSVLSRAKHFVISGSTFSFWSCWLAAQHGNVDLTVVAPESARSQWTRFQPGFAVQFISN